MNSTAKENIRVVIIEDEVHNSRMLRGLIEKLQPNWNVICVLESIEESVKWFKNNKAPNLVLMDIQLSDGICFTIFEQVSFDTSCRIIFTTAYDEYAIRAFKVNSIDYLLKPIEEAELEKAFRKFEQLTHIDTAPIHELNDYNKLIDSILSGKKEYRTRFLISGISGYKKINTEDIAYFYSDNKFTFAVDNNKKEYTLDYNLEQLESELDPVHFFRANRKVIVHIDSVKKVNNDTGGKLTIELTPQPNFEITISRLKANEFKVWMGK